ncbi:MAG: SDR family oxidoreductase [Oricola sp.]
MAEDIFSVEGRVCLVTGASSGLGAHFAMLLSGRGARVAGASRGKPATPLDNVFHLDCDIRNSATVTATFDAIERTLGPVEVLVNAAGIAGFERAESMDDAAFAELLDVNISGTMRVTREAAKRMQAAKRGGSIINVTSVLATKTMSGLSAYGSSKAALEHLTRSLASEWARHGVRVNALAPGWFPTAMTRKHFDKGLDKILQTRIPMRRLGEPRDLDGALLLLASDASRYMTGSVITVDGGFVAGV